ncbi:hypothetical protein [Chitinophaga sancti]|uniref:hypothetical protein n=1 Tax=Chitinophaga sancti TaxID=1004 RepID=UPI003F78E16A
MHGSPGEPQFQDVSFAVNEKTGFYICASNESGTDVCFENLEHVHNTGLRLEDI